MTTNTNSAASLAKSLPALKSGLISELTALHQEMLDTEAQGMRQAGAIHPDYQASARNLLHYLALRRREVRHLQEQLAMLGLSSLGRAESHVLASVRAVLRVLHQLAAINEPLPEDSPPVTGMAEGVALLERHTAALLGPPTPQRRVRIMVTLPTEAATDPRLIEQLLVGGMDCARINCAHDSPTVWAKMIAHLRKAEQALSRRCRLLMDLGGPKLRTGPIETGPPIVKWRPRRDPFGRVTAPARIWLYPEGTAAQPPDPAAASLPLPHDALARLEVGDRIDFRDRRNARRFLWVVEAAGPCRWAEAVRTAYVAPGTVLHAKATGRRGPLNLCVGEMPPPAQALLLKPGDLLVVTSDRVMGRPARPDEAGDAALPANIGCTLPGVLADVRGGERVWFDDGKIGGVIESVEADQIRVRVTHAPVGGAKLRADKGINLPDSTLRVPALTEKDLEDLPFVAAHADLVGYSFVRSAADVHELEARLQQVGGAHLGIVLKIETRAAFERLPELLLASMRTPCDGVMIARGDLAIECGFERLAEVQEEILWICEAAHVPVIWATQVLEGLAKGGRPSRAEVSDAAIGQRADCVMLNKGPHIVAAVRTLDDILQRMQAHQAKKRSLLRPLELARRFPAASAIG